MTRSPHASVHLKVLKHLLAASTGGVLGAEAPALAQDITTYLLKHDLYAHLERAIRSIVCRLLF
jgi:ubiquitin-protein ligase E3 C